MVKTISILGCGWLGFPLANLLVQDGFSVKGSTTSPEKIGALKEAGIQPFHLNLPLQNTTKEQEDFFDCDLLFINIPPRTRSRGPDAHLAQIQSIIPLVKEHTKIIYVSATSVYPKINTAITEDTPVDKDSERAKALFQVENLLTEHFTNNLCIARFGGLMGYDRFPGKYIAGKEVTETDTPVNYIHQDDAAALSTLLIKHFKPTIYNVVAPEHPTKKEVYLNSTQQFNLEPPVFKKETSSEDKRYISSEKIIKELNYSFKYPDPLEFKYG